METDWFIILLSLLGAGLVCGVSVQVRAQSGVGVRILIEVWDRKSEKETKLIMEQGWGPISDLYNCCWLAQST